MTLLFKKITTAALSLTMVGGVILSIGTSNNRSDYQLDAAFSGATTVYLDKTYIITQLGWWNTNEPYLHYWTSSTGDKQITMTPVPVDDNSKTYYKVEIPSSVVNEFSSNGGFRFFVFDRSTDKNQTQWINGADWKSQDYNLFVIDTANDGWTTNGDNQQHMDWFVSTC